MIPIIRRPLHRPHGRAQRRGLARAALLAVLSLACLLPASAQFVRVPAGRRLASRVAVVAADGSLWKTRAAGPGGPLRSLRGRVPLTGANPEQKAADFVARHGTLFGVDSDVQLGAPRVLARHALAEDGAPGGPRALRLPQLVQGAPLAGHGLTLLFDTTGELTQAHGMVSAVAGRLPPALLDEQTARATALAALAAAGYDTADLRAGPTVTSIARLGADRPHLLFSVEVVLRAGAHPWAVEVDAHDGTLFALRDLAQEGTGNFLFEGGQQSFKTGNGKGTLYKSIKHAIASKSSSGKLTDVSRQTVVKGLAEDGFLFGRFAQIIDDTLSVATSDKHDWSTGTDDPQGPFDQGDPNAPGQFFDHTNTYSWITRTARYMEKVFGVLGSDYAIPVIVNVEGLLNAFFSGADYGLGHGPGFFAFGDDDDKTGDFMDDFSRDPSVVSHEYTHGVVDKFGLTFGDAALDTPSRALNEAVADYFAASFHRSPCIGEQFMTAIGPKLGVTGKCLRDLSEVRRMPLDLFDELGQTGLPEEHEAGVIFGGTLYRIGMALKRKKGDLAVANALFAFPSSAAEVGFPVVDESNALFAYQDYFAVAIWELLDGLADVTSGKLVGKAFGAALQLGVINDLDEGTWWLADLSDGGKAGYKSVFLPGVTEHPLGFFVRAGQTVTIKVKGAKGTTLDFDLLLVEGDVLAPEAKQTNKKGTAVTLRNVQAVQDSTLLLDISASSAAGGPYKAILSVKG